MKNKKRSISQVLSLFITSSTFILGILIAGFMAIRMNQAIYNNQQTQINSQVQALADDISQYLQRQQQLLNDHASFPTLIQGVMQPQVNLNIVKDFMNDLSFLGKQYQEVLLDFRGDKIYATQTAPIFNYSQQPWVKNLTEQKSTTFRGISYSNDGKYYWQLAQTVLYNNMPEGVLVVEIPIDDLDKELTENHLGNITLDIIWKERLIKRIGKPVTGDIIELDEPISGSLLKFQIDNSIPTQTRYRLILENIALLLLLAFFASSISSHLGKRWFIYPIQRLQLLTQSIADDDKKDLIQQGEHIQEFYQLAQGFNHMAQRIQKRESALRESYDKLEQLNEKLQDSRNQLVQSEKMASLGTLAAGVAHEINNPISFVKNNIAVLRNYLTILLPIVKDYYRYAHKQQQQQPELMEAIDRHLNGESLDYILEDTDPLLADAIEGVNRVKDIVGGLKSFSHANHAQRQQQQWFDLNQCIATTLKIVWSELKYTCEVHQELAELPLIKGNQGQITQVIINLLINAVQAIPEKGEITIETSVVNNYVQLCVSDTGTGITPEHLEQLFTPFFTTKPEGMGTGLGLSISHGIIEHHGGTIKASSTVGEGTTFTIQLPINSTDDE